MWRPLIGIGIEAKATTKQYSAKLPERGRRGPRRDDNPERGELRAPYEIKESLRGRGKISKELIAARYPDAKEERATLLLLSLRELGEVGLLRFIQRIS